HGSGRGEPAARGVVSVKSRAGIAEAVINTAVEADVRAPVAAVPDVKAVVPSPITGRPVQAYRSDHPGTGHPVVAIVIVPRPVAGRPDVAGAGADGLRVDRQRGWADPHRYEDLRVGGHRK